MNISSYQLKKAKETKPIWSDLNSCFFIGEYDVRSNKKGSWSCTCKFASDGKTKNKPCSHILSIYWFYEKPTMRSMLDDSIKNIEKELNKLKELREEC